jgi:hypothetical protein
MKIFTKKYWQTRSQHWMRSWQILNANRKMFMFKYAYNTKSKVQCIFAPFLALFVFFLLAPVIVLQVVLQCMISMFDTVFPIIRSAIGMDMRVNPEWYKLSQQDKINKWKTWE